ncbi:hypothetical protein MMC28_004169 [Mycoblastus sanguinarius]|nr:hypothetical protein [Mycoblastus sanguinarius]
MSLHRVSSMSSYEHVRGSSPARSEHRKMSFNPVGTWVPPVAKEEPVRAFEVSRITRILQVTIAVIYSLFSAGIIFGYAAIKPVLIKEGVYSQFCDKAELMNTSRTCYEQEIRLNFMFTAAAVTTNVCALPVGIVLDRYGPRISGLVGSVLLTVGALLMAFATQLPFDAYIPGYLFLALGGPFVFISSFQLSNTFPQYSGLILALMTGAFDSSSAIFLFYRLIYNASNGSFTPQKFFLVYLVVPIYIIIVQIFIMPANSYKTPGELVANAQDPSYDIGDTEIEQDTVRKRQIQEQRRQHRESAVDEMTSLLGKSGDKQQEATEKKQKISGVFGAQHGRSAFEQIRTPWFIFITIFTVIQMTRINYFVATVRTQYEYMLHSDVMADHVNQFFDIALPVGGVLSIPMIGLVLDNTSTAFTLLLLVMAATVIGVLGVLPFLWAGYANIILFVLYRPLYYTAVSDYTVKVFGVSTFGKVYGLVICFAGLLNFSQSALDVLTQRTFHRDPLPVNIILLVVCLVVGLVLVGYVYYKSRAMERDRLEEEAEETPDTVMPGADFNGGAYGT